MLNKTNILTLLLLQLAFITQANSDLESVAKQSYEQNKQHNIARESRFEEELKVLKEEHKSLQMLRDEISESNERLMQLFNHNESVIAEQDNTLQSKSAELRELFAVVRKSAKGLKLELDNSVNNSAHQYNNDQFNTLTEAKVLPSISAIESLWHAYTGQIEASRKLTKVDVSFISGEGRTETAEAIQLGLVGLVGEKGYLKWDGKHKEASYYLKQPQHAPTLSSLLEQGNSSNVLVAMDPSRGEILDQLAMTPSLMERFEAGGGVAKVLVGLLLVGVLISLIQGVRLTITFYKIKKQFRCTQKLGDNPLGRILAVTEENKGWTVEALELRLLEVVMDAQGELERGLPMLKLLAALAPMLGLLGTVTGMIETFQVITQFGNGDPKVMAGGISMALVTTVLGLIVAIPLLLAHNILTSKAEKIRHMLEKQGVALVAEQAEKSFPQGVVA